MRRYYSYPEKAEPLSFPSEPIARFISTAAIIVCIGLVFLNVVFHFVFDPQKVVEREMEKITADYYENYYYDSFTENMSDEDFAMAFSTYSEFGFPRVYLRELLLFDDGRHEGSRSIFDSSYSCDTNHTSVQIYPKAPFGKKDYTVKYNYSCEWTKD